jgi:hypothetical protein
VHPYVVHLKNKYPDTIVQATEQAIDVFRGDEHLLSLQRSGATGAFEDASERLGLPERFCLAPIPKESRVFKFSKDGKIVRDEKAAERESARAQFLDNGKVLSKVECEARGLVFDADGHVKGGQLAAANEE